MEANVTLVGTAAFKADVLVKNWKVGSIPTRFRNVIMKIFFNYLFKILWITTFFMIIFLDRNNQ